MESCWQLANRLPLIQRCISMLNGAFQGRGHDMLCISLPVPGPLLLVGSEAAFQSFVFFFNLLVIPASY